jgi:hypothetical protein
MGATPQFLWYLFPGVPLVAGILLLVGLSGVSQVRQKDVEVEELSWKMLANWLDDLLAVMEALSVHIEMAVVVLGTGKGGTFETHHNHLGAGYFVATVAHNLDIFGLRC